MYKQRGQGWNNLKEGEGQGTREAQGTGTGSEREGRERACRKGRVGHELSCYMPR